MSTDVGYPHLSLNSDGKLSVGGTRYTVEHLCSEHHCYGWTAEELLRQHLDLKPQEVYAALTYFYDHREEMLRVINHASANSTGQPVSTNLSRAELLRRRSLQANQ